MTKFYLSILFVCINSSVVFSQNYFNHSIQLLAGPALPVGEFGASEGESTNGNAKPGYVFGIQLEAPIYKGLKQFTGIRYNSFSYNIQAFEEVAIQQFQNTIFKDMVEVEAFGKGYSSVQLFTGLSYYIDITGSKKMFLQPKLGVGLTYFTIKDLSSDIYMLGNISTTTTFKRTETLEVMGIAGLDIKYYISKRNILLLSSDYTLANLNFDKLEMTNYDHSTDQTDVRINPLTMPYSSIQFMLGYGYNF